MCFPFCFPDIAKLITPEGTSIMKDLNIGDTVRVVTPEGRVEWSQVCGWLHHEPNSMANFLRLTTSRRQILVSGEHLIAIVKAGQVVFVPASQVPVGSVLLECDTALQSTPNTSQIWGNAVQRVEHVQLRGIYAPLTVAGTIVVDGVAASCYAHTHSHKAAHAAMKPMRTMWRHNPEKMKQQPHVGKHIPGAHKYVDVLARVAGKV